jgi:hypothetical protein
MMPRNITPTVGLEPAAVVNGFHQFQADSHCVNEVVRALEVRLEALMARQSELTENAKEKILLALENAVRIGWVLIDIRTELKKIGPLFDQYARNRFSFSKSQVYRLITAAKRFERDQVELDFRLSISGEATPGDLSEIPLIEQIRETKASTFSDLLITGGVVSGRTQAPSISMPPICKLYRRIDAVHCQFVRTERQYPIADWSEADIAVLIRKLQPLVSLHAQLLERAAACQTL